MDKTIDKKKSLDAYTPDEVVELKTRLNNLEARIGPLADSVETLVGNYDKFWSQFEAMKETLANILEGNKAALEARRETRMVEAIESIPRAVLAAMDNLVTYKQGAEERIVQRRGGGQVPVPTTTPSAPRDLSALNEYASLIDIENVGGVSIVKPKKFLGDLWGPIMATVRNLGGTWVRDDKNSHWEIGGTGGAPSSSPRPQSGGKPQIRDPGAPASEKQIALLNKLKVFVKPGLTKGEASELIDAKLKKR